LFQIVHQNTLRQFTLAEANQLIPLLYRMTEDVAGKAKYLSLCLTALPDKKSERAEEIQNQINALVDTWQRKVERLGMKPKGLWLADFDNGDGYFCWKFPESQILFKHGYQDGFTGRRLISSVEDNHENSSLPN
jgi:hypothetical protein